MLRSFGRVARASYLCLVREFRGGKGEEVILRVEDGADPHGRPAVEGVGHGDLGGGREQARGGARHDRVVRGKLIKICF